GGPGVEAERVTPGGEITSVYSDLPAAPDTIVSFDPHPIGHNGVGLAALACRVGCRGVSPSRVLREVFDPRPAHGVHLGGVPDPLHRTVVVQRRTGQGGPRLEVPRLH